MPVLRPLLLLASLAAVAAPATAGAQRRERDREFRMDTTFAFDARGTAELSIADGTLLVSTWSRNEARVVVVSNGERYEMRGNASRFSLEPEDAYRGDARVEVTLPASARVSVETRSGDVRVTRVQGDVTVRAQNGDIQLDDLAGRVDVSVMSGDLQLSNITGDIQVNAINGDVDLNRVQGQVGVETVSGDISVRDATSRWVRLRSTSGDLDYSGAVTAGGRYELGTHSGDVTMTLPENPSASLTVSTFNGEIESDFPITLAPGAHDIGVGRSKRFNFDVGRGEARVTLESFSGDITLRGRGVPRPTR